MITDKTVSLALPATAVAFLILIVLAIVFGIRSPSTAPAEPEHIVAQPLQWSIADLNESDCLSIDSLDSWMQALHDPNYRLVKTEHKDGSVWVSRYLDGYAIKRWRIYPTRLACLESISNYTYTVR